MADAAAAICLAPLNLIKEDQRIDIFGKIVQPFFFDSFFFGVIGLGVPDLEGVARCDKERLAGQSDFFAQLRA